MDRKASGSGVSNRGFPACLDCVAAKIGTAAPLRQRGWAAVVEGSSGWPKQETARSQCHPELFRGAQEDCIAKNMRFYDQLMDFVRFAR